MATLFTGRADQGRRLACVLLLTLLLSAFGESGNGLEEGLAHLRRASGYAGHENWSSAAHEAAAAVSSFRRSEKRLLSEALEVLAGAEVMLRQSAKAADHYREALSLCGGCKKRDQLRLGLANAERDLGRFDEAETLLKSVLKDAEAAGSTADQAKSFSGLAAVAIAQDRHAEAIPLLREGLRRQDAATQPVFRAELLESLGVLLTETGDGLRALDVLRQAEALRARLGDPSGLLRVRTNIAKAYLVLGRYDAALALFAEVEAACRQRGDQDELARTLVGSAAILEKLGQVEEAQRKLEEALPIEQRNGRHGGEANVLDHLGRLDLARGQYDRAFARFEEALAASRKAPDRQSELTSLVGTANIYLELNREDEASARMRRVAELSKHVAAQNRSVEALLAINQLFESNRLDEALRQTDQALALARESGARPAEEITLVLRAALLVRLDRLEEGRHAAEAALALSRELGDRAAEAQVNSLVGYILLLERRYESARVSLEQSLRFEREIGSSGPRASTLWSLGAASEKEGDFTAAIAAYREAAEILESGFGEIQADDLLAGLTENAAGAYGRWTRLLAQKGDVEQAFAVAERARARAFLRRMGNPSSDLRQGVDPVLAREEESLREKIQSLARQLRLGQRQSLSEQDGAKVAAIARQLDSARREYGTLLIRLQQASPEYASLVHPATLTVPEVQRLLDGETTLIKYFLVEDDSLAWVIEKDSVHLVHPPLQGQDLANRINTFRSRIANRQPVAVDAFQLYLGLFGPLVPYIHHRKLIVVPHGALHAVPFAALTPDVGKTYLLEHYALSTLPSASVLPFVLAKRRGEGGGMLALGDPDGSLPEAAAEARAVAALYGSRALVGPDATAAALRGARGPIDNLHIAAHAVFDPARPLFSSLRLADGDLSVHDIFGLDLRRTRLVVLSGCETGVGKATEADQLEGLSRAFLYAGALAVVATQWAVDDAASRTLMEAFYRRLRGGIRAAEALRLAQIDILRRKEWGNPYYWAAFTLTGDPGP